MAEQLSHSPVQDPTHNEPGLPRRNQLLVVDGLAFDVFDVPALAGDQEVNRLAVNNAEGFGRFVTQGLDALVDGESVSWTTLFDRQEETPDLPKLYQIRRQDGDVIFRRLMVPQTSEVTQLPEPQDNPSVLDTGLAVRRNAVDELVGNYDLFGASTSSLGGLADRADRLGNVVRALGFSPESVVAEELAQNRSGSITRFPLPLTLQHNIRTVREDTGLNVPEIRIIAAPHIDDEPFNDCFGAAEAPASALLNYFGHDALSDHYRPQIVFNGVPMTMAQLYAKAGYGAESVTTRRERTRQAAKLPNYRATEFTSTTPEQKLSFMADTLDKLSAEFDLLVPAIDQPAEAQHPMDANQEYNAISSEVAQTILDSPYRQEFLDLLTALNSGAVDEHGVFSADRFKRDMVRWAQSFWGIEPKA